MQTSTIALIADNSNVRQTLNSALSNAGYAVLETEIRMLGVQGGINDVSVVCIGAANEAELAHVDQVLALDADLPIVVVTSNTQVAERAIQRGAYDSICEPFQTVALQRSFTRAVEHRNLAQKVSWLRRQLDHYESEEVVPLRELERRAIERALRAANGSVTKAAKLLGIGRATLYRRLASPEMADIRARRGTEPDVTAPPQGPMSSFSQATMGREP